MEPMGRREPARGRFAGPMSAGAFAYALVATVALMAITGLFEDEDNRNTLLAWLAVPIVTGFISWLAVLSGRAVMRLIVWLSALLCLFFCWIAVFSVGLVYLPVPILLTLAGFAPWPERSARPLSEAESSAFEEPAEASPEDAS